MADLVMTSAMRRQAGRRLVVEQVASSQLAVVRNRRAAGRQPSVRVVGRTEQTQQKPERHPPVKSRSTEQGFTTGNPGLCCSGMSAGLGPAYFLRTTPCLEKHGGLTPSRSPGREFSKYLAEVSPGFRWGGKGVARNRI